MKPDNPVLADLNRKAPLPTEIPRGRLDFGTFYRDFQQANLPVILEGAIDHWTALANWTPSYLRDTYPDTQLKLPDGKGLTRLDDYITSVLDAPPDKPPTYLRNVKVRGTFPEILPDIDEDFLFARLDVLNSMLLPRNWIREDRQVELFIGGAGPALTLMHYDEFMLHNFIIAIHGDDEVRHDPARGHGVCLPEG